MSTNHVADEFQARLADGLNEDRVEFTLSVPRPARQSHRRLDVLKHVNFTGWVLKKSNVRGIRVVQRRQLT